MQQHTTLFCYYRNPLPDMISVYCLIAHGNGIVRIADHTLL